MIRSYTQLDIAQRWIDQVRGRSPIFTCVLGFTETGLLPGISAAGATPDDRRYTAIADAEFLHNGPQPNPVYPLPPLMAGASPVLISRAVVEAQTIPTVILNAGLPVPPAVPTIDLGGFPAQCVSTGQAMTRSQVEHLLSKGLHWGHALAQRASYVIIGECVVGGTTTALALLTGLGWDAAGRVNSSHPTCNHQQKWDIVQRGLNQAGLWQSSEPDPMQVVAAVGDPMQIVVAGMAIAASQQKPVLLAGGTQMLTVYALAEAIAQTASLPWQRHQVVVGTTRWVAEDPTGDTVGLATLLNAPLLATQLSFALSQFPTLRSYEEGFVKEGVGAGGCAIAAHLYQGWGQVDLLRAIEALCDRYLASADKRDGSKSIENCLTRVASPNASLE